MNRLVFIKQEFEDVPKLTKAMWIHGITGFGEYHTSENQSSVHLASRLMSSMEKHFVRNTKSKDLNDCKADPEYEIAKRYLDETITPHFEMHMSNVLVVTSEIAMEGLVAHVRNQSKEASDIEPANIIGVVCEVVPTTTQVHRITRII